MKRAHGGRWGVAILALAGGFCAATACRRAPKPGVVPAPRPSSVEPVLRSTEPRYDFGSVVQGAPLQHSFDVSNTGTARLDLEPHAEALGCSGELTPASLAPGEHARFAVTCQFEYYGPQRVTLPVRGREGSAILAALELEASVTPLLAFDTPLVSVRVPFGEERGVDVYAQGALAAQAKLGLVSSGDTVLSATLISDASGAPLGLRLRVRGRKVGTHVGNLSVTTNLDRPKELSLPYSYEVLGTLEVTPSTPYFDAKLPGAQLQQILVHSSQAGFAVQSVCVSEGPFHASVARGTAGGYAVTVALDAARMHPGERGSVGRLVIVSNDHTEPEKELPLFAFGAPE